MLTDNTTIAILLTTAAVCQILGTIAVTVNYYRTGVIADLIVKGSDAQLASVFWERKKLAGIAQQLTRRWWLTLGLIAYIIGAISGLCGGLIWLYR
jgi:hypothetical protein